MSRFRLYSIIALVAAWQFVVTGAMSRKAALAGSFSASNLVANANFEVSASGGQAPAGFELTGQATYGELGENHERAGKGIRLQSAGGKRRSGSVSTIVRDLPTTARWFRLRIVALAQEGFAVEQDDLYLDVEFFRDAGRNSLDHVKKRIYPLVVQDREKLLDPGTNRNLGPASSAAVRSRVSHAVSRDRHIETHRRLRPRQRARPAG